MSVDTVETSVAWARRIGVRFPLLEDKGGRLSARYGLYDARNHVAAKAVVLVREGRAVYTEKVRKTAIPARVAPWGDHVTGR